MNSITTKGGDGGMSSLYSGERASKADGIFEALGTLDELNSWLGLIKLHLTEGWIRAGLERIQLCLFRIASNLATTDSSDARSNLQLITTADLEWLESYEEKLLAEVAMPTTFIIPGMELRAAWTDITRTVCRRGERRVVELMNGTLGTSVQVDVKYLNRLSDVLYIVARHFEDGGFKEK